MQDDYQKYLEYKESQAEVEKIREENIADQRPSTSNQSDHKDEIHNQFTRMTFTELVVKVKSK